MSLLFAICGKKDNLLAKEIPLNEEAQAAVESIFLEQAQDFQQNNEIPYDPNWNLSDDEIMTIRIPQNVTIFKQIQETMETSFEPIDTKNFDSENIQALAIKDEERVLVQTFRTAQSLTKDKLALLFRRGTFTHLKETAFHLDKELLCIIEDGLIKFRSLKKLGRIINTTTIFRAATNSEVRSFIQNNAGLFSVSNIDDFLHNTSRNARIYIASIIEAGALGQHTVQTLLEEADKTNLKVQVNQRGKIVMPESSNEITELLRFLNDGRYPGPISKQTYITNSRRLADT